MWLATTNQTDLYQNRVITVSTKNFLFALGYWSFFRETKIYLPPLLPDLWSNVTQFWLINRRMKVVRTCLWPGLRHYRPYLPAAKSRPKLPNLFLSKIVMFTYRHGLAYPMTDESWRSLVEGGEGSYLPNGQTNLVIGLFTLSLLFYKFINTTADHLGRYKPSSP